MQRKKKEEEDSPQRRRERQRKRRRGRTTEKQRHKECTEKTKKNGRGRELSSLSSSFFRPLTFFFLCVLCASAVISLPLLRGGWHERLSFSQARTPASAG